MTPFYQGLFSYSYHVNLKIIELFQQKEYQLDTSIELFSHILGAQHFWECRINSKKYKYSLFDPYEISVMKDRADEIHNDWKSILQNQPLEKVIFYQSTIGKKYENTISEIAFHVINHSTHHRAQICSFWRKEGLTPPLTDYIFFKRTELK